MNESVCFFSDNVIDVKKEKSDAIESSHTSEKYAKYKGLYTDTITVIMTGSHARQCQPIM